MPVKIFICENVFAATAKEMCSQRSLNRQLISSDIILHTSTSSSVSNLDQFCYLTEILIKRQYGE